MGGTIDQLCYNSFNRTYRYLSHMSTAKPIDFYRVVLVDDHQHIHDAVPALLKTVSDIRLVGHEYRGEDAAELARTTKRDLMLLDVVMRGMNSAMASHTRLA